MRAPLIEVGEAGFVPEGDEIPDAGVDSREAIIATGKVSLLVEEHTEGGEINDNLDALSDSGR